MKTRFFAFMVQALAVENRGRVRRRIAAGRLTPPVSRWP
jgi:hypothetical protein